MCTVRIWRALPLAVLDHAADLLVDQLCRRVGHVLALGHGVTEEHFFLVLAVAQRSELVGEAELRDHPARKTGGAADVVGGAQVVTFSVPKISSSATRPPNRPAIRASRRLNFECEYLSLLRQEHG